MFYFLPNPSIDVACYFITYGNSNNVAYDICALFASLEMLAHVHKSSTSGGLL
jgi:hypothetical protein